MRLQPFSSLLLLMALCTSAHADFLTGRVIDSTGAGVGGVDIDAKNTGSGGDPVLMNDGTDPNGFFNVTIPAGEYRITFNPPPPPTTTHLVLEVDDVIVVGTKNMGDVSLPPGVSLSAKVVDTLGGPVAGVNVDVIDETSGDNLNLVNDATDAFGNFSVAVPAGPIELRLNATPVIGPTLASLAVSLSPTANTVLPDQVLFPGFELSGTVLSSSGQPLEDVDLDVHDSATSKKLYTPGDNTDGSGFYDLVVPAGTYDISICPSSALLQVAAGFDDFVVTQDENLGTTQLVAGVLLFGNVTTWAGAIVAGGDLDVDFSGGGSIVTCGDNTDAAGNYAIVVPTGTLQVSFSPSDWTQPLGRDIQTVVVSSTQSLNGVLPACSFPTNYGSGLAGTAGFVPQIAGAGGAPSTGNSALGIEMSNGIGGGLVILITAAQSLSIPLFGGTLLAHVDPNISSLYGFTMSGPVGVGGVGSASFTFPPLGAFVGITAYCQFLVRDLGAPAGWAMSDGLQFLICP